MDGFGHIYLLRRPDGWFRIGRTRNLCQRFGWYKWWSRINHYQLKPVLVVAVERAVSAERLFHAIFADKRAKPGHQGPRREWFKLDERDLGTFLYWAEIIGVQTIPLNGHWDISEIAMMTCTNGGEPTEGQA